MITGELIDRISEDPFDRLKTEMKEVLQRERLFFDVHCHLFNYRDVPDGFLGIRLPFRQRFMSRMEHLLHNLVKRTDRDKFSNLAYFIHIFKTREPGDTTRKLAEYFSEYDIVLVPLMMDMIQGIKGSTKDSFTVQIEKMKLLRDQFPARLLPFLATDPLNPEMNENFLKVFDQQQQYRFNGIKIYPSLGYLPSHPRLMEIYEICQEKNIPLTAHCSGATVHNSRKRISGIRGYWYDTEGNLRNDETSRTFRRREEYSNFFNHPKNWEKVLQTFPRLKLNLAHFGGDFEWERYIKGKTDSWVHRILDMMARYRNLYADFSYTCYNYFYSERLQELIMKNRLVAERTLYGSDYYMTVREGHFRNIRMNFHTALGDEVLHKIAVTNPKEFLFGRSAD